MKVLIRVADLLSAQEIFEVSEHRQIFEAGVRSRLSRVPIDIAFDWTLMSSNPANAILFFDRKGYPVRLPARLVGLVAVIEQAIAHALSRVALAMEGSPVRAQRWSTRAEEFRSIAESTSSADERAAFLALASSFQQIADRLADHGVLGSLDIVQHEIENEVEVESGIEEAPAVAFQPRHNAA